MIIIYFILLSFALFAIGIAGALASRHILLIIISTELILIASTLIGIGFFDFYRGNIIPFLFTVWGVAASEIIMLVVFYKYLSRYEKDMDITKLSELRN